MQQLKQHGSPLLRDEIGCEDLEEAARQLVAGRECDRRWREERKAVLERRIGRMEWIHTWLSYLASAATLAGMLVFGPPDDPVWSENWFWGILLLPALVWVVAVSHMPWWARPLVAEWKALQPVEDAGGCAEAPPN